MKPAYRLINKKSGAGFSLTETLVALGVLSIFFAAIIGILDIVFNLVGESRLRSTAISLAQERIEYIRNLPYTSIGIVDGIPTGVLEQEEIVTINTLPFTIETSVVYVDDPFDGTGLDDSNNTDYKRARVSISWGGAFASKSPLVFVTNVSPKGLESEVNGGTLSINVFDANGDPIEGASVRIENTVVDPTIDFPAISDPQGKVYLPGSPECTQCYQITVTKDKYSSNRTYDTTEVTNPLKPHATIIEGDVTEISFNIDRLSTLVVKTTGSVENNYPSFTGVQFILRGAKTIGTNSNDEPVYKYEQTHVSGSGGTVTISDLEWDLYEVFIPLTSSVDFAGSRPISPFSLPPDTTRNLDIVTSFATAHSLLAIITDSNDTPLATASVSLSSGEFEASKSTGLSNKGDWGQAFFSGLTQDTYSITASLPLYKQATASASVSGDIKETIVLELE